MTPGRAAPLLSLAFASALGALDPALRVTQYLHRSWGVDEGLPQSSVMAIAQTPDGFLWLGTQEGLVRFDGLRFAPAESLAQGELPGRQALALLVDRAGDLWIGTESGLARLRDRRIESWGQGLPPGAVYGLAESADGTLWAATHTGLARRAGSRFEPVHAGGEPLGAVYSLLARADGRLWVGSAAQGLRRLESNEGRPELPLVGPERASVYGMAESADGTLWAATRGKGLLELRGESLRRWTQADGLPSDGITAVAIDREGAVWFGADDGSLGRLRGGRVEVLDGAARFTPLEITKLFEDREGNLWIGSDGGGLHRFRDGALVPWGRPEGLADDIALVVLGSRDGTLWVGTENGGLSRIDGDRIENVDLPESGRRVAVLALAEGRDGTLWAGTKGAGLCRVRGTERSCENVGAGLARGSVLALLEDRRGELWVGTPEGIYRRGAKGFARLADGTPLADAFVLLLAQTRDGALWAGTLGAGLWRADEAEPELWRRVDLPVEANATWLLEDDDGTLWLGTAGQGLLRRRQERWEVFGRRQGLVEETIFAVVDGGDGHLWLSGNRGIARIPRAQLVGPASSTRLTPRLFERGDGARSRECNGGTQPAAARTRDGRLWFPTLSGVVAYDPTRQSRNHEPPRVEIERVAIDGAAAERAASLQIPPGTGRLEIAFTAASLAAPERVRFRYRLAGYDRDWVEGGTARSAVYGRLPPGRYRLEVAAVNEDGVESAAPALLELAVQPSLQETAVFRIGTGFAVLLLAFAAYRLRVRRLEEQRRRLADLVDERTGELAAVNDQLRTANLELERLSATDSLTGLANRRRFDERLEQEWRRASRDGSGLALIVLDVDAFKAYNDRYGHPAGDDCLRRVASVLSAAARRAGDVAARLGGEEFALLAPGLSLEAALAAGESLRREVEALAVPHKASAIAPVVTVSAGVAAATPAASAAPASLLERADRALYRAKQGGRNRSLADSGS